MDMFDQMLSKGGLSLDRLNNFCRIAEAGGITKAAGGDPGKQSLYSRQIKELETFFGLELKVRQGKGIALTDAGQRLAGLHALISSDWLTFSGRPKTCHR